MLFSLIYSDWSFQEKSIYFIAFLLCIVVALTLHEFAHAFAAVKSGDPTPKVFKRYSINPVRHIDLSGAICFLLLGFGWAKPVPVNTLNFKNHYKAKTFWVSISGVLTNLIVAFIFTGLWYLWQYTGFFGGFAFQFFLYFFSLMIQINLILFVFNLLPIYPLDGFNAIASFMRYENKFITFMRKYGVIILWGFLIAIFLIESLTGFDLISWLTYWVGYPMDRLWRLIFFGF